jgi:hypothetical protein
MSLSKNYFDLDFLLNIYNDYIYRKTPENSYRFEPISRQKIKLEDLKMPEDFDSTAIINLTGNDLKYLGTWKGEHHFKRKSKTGGFPCRLIIGKYDTQNANNMNEGVIYNVGIMYILSELVATEHFKHSLLPVMLFDIEYSELVKRVPDFEKYTGNNKDSMMYCLVVEQFTDQMTLREYLESAPTIDVLTWKVIFFQILFALFKINDRLSQFRHNRLDLDSLLVCTKQQQNSTDTYKIGDIKFGLPNVGFDIKLSNYQFATTSDYIPNTDIGKKIYNEYYDVHYFMNYLLLWSEKNKFVLPKEIIGFIGELVPDSLKIRKLDGYGGMDESADYKVMNPNRSIPVMILKKNNFFKQFIIIGSDSNMDMSASPVDNTAKVAPVKGGMSSEFSEGEYIRSITESNSDNPRLLGRRINKKSYLTNNRTSMSSNNSHLDIRKSDLSEDENLLSRAERHYKKSKKGKNADSYGKAVNIQMFGKNKSKSKKSKRHKKVKAFEETSASDNTMSVKYDAYFSALRNISRNKSADQLASEKVRHDSDPRISSDQPVQSIFSSGKNKKEQESEYSSSVSSVSSVSSDNHDNNRKNDSDRIMSTSDSTGTAKYQHYLDALSRSNLKKEDGSKQQNNKGNGYEVYLGEKLAERINSLPVDYVGELPPHLAHMLPNEDGQILNPSQSTMQAQKPNQMAGLLGFGGQESGQGMGMGMGMGMGAGETPQGFYPNRQQPSQGMGMGTGMGAGMGMGMGMGMGTGMGAGMQMPEMPMQMPEMPMQSNMMQSMGQPMGQPMGMGQSMGQPMGMGQSMGQPMGMGQSMGQPMGMGMGMGMGMPEMGAGLPHMAMGGMQEMQGAQGMQGMAGQGVQPAGGLGMPVTGMMGGSGKRYTLRKIEDIVKSDGSDKKNFFF